jgi:bacteriocin biosynthesis cyclodehydratase domain-containing protein
MRASAEDVRVSNPTAAERELLGALDGTNTISDLEARFGAGEVCETLAQMRELFLLEDAADYDAVPAAELERFDRQLRYFSDIGEGGPSPSECQERLRAASVAVLGVGGLGGRAAWELAACGVGELRLIDCDRVEVSNLNRQIQYTEADLGLQKAEVTAARLRAFNSQIRVTAASRRMESQADIADFIDGADLVIDAADWPAHEIEFWCNGACFSAGIPYLAMSHFPPIARVGPLYVPGHTGCFQCQVIRYRREYPLFDVAIAQRRAIQSPAATLGPACGLVGGLIGMEALHFLTGLVEPAALGVAFTYDLRTMAVEQELITAEPSCPVCSHLAIQREVAVYSELVTAKGTYDAFAPVYDDFNHNYRYEKWTMRLLSAAESTGLVGGRRRLLDVGCGTGLSFLPMLGRGWKVTACDISPAMLERAAEKVEGETVELLVADMRALPIIHGDFDLIWAVNDAINYLGSAKELTATLTGMAKNLIERGRIVFDVNTMLNYQRFFSSDHDVSTDAGILKWRGLTKAAALRPSAFIEARLEVASNGTTHVHRQRHFSNAEILAAIGAAGLECLAVLGEDDGELQEGLDESMHTKGVYVCSHATAAG